MKEGDFTNDEKGLKSLKTWLKKVGVKFSELRVCMKSNNIYWEKAADYFYAEGATVHVVNPMRTSGFGLSQVQLSGHSCWYVTAGSKKTPNS